MKMIVKGSLKLMIEILIKANNRRMPQINDDGVHTS